MSRTSNGKLVGRAAQEDIRDRKYDLQPSTPLTQFERLSVKLEVANSMIKQDNFPSIQEKGFVMSGEIFVALVDLALRDEEHINTASDPLPFVAVSKTVAVYPPEAAQELVKFSPAWFAEQEAQARDWQDWQNQTNELRGGL